MRGIKALAAAASAAVMTLAFAGHASAGTEITVTGVDMFTGYTATIGNEDAYTNIMRFTANVAGNPAANVPDLYGFCIDIGHNIGLSDSYSLDYYDNQGDGAPLLNYGSLPTPTTLDPGIAKQIGNLVDAGYLLYVNNVGTAGQDDMWLQEAAIQAAIWKIENPGVKVSVDQGSALDSGGTSLGTYFDNFSNDTWSPAAYGVTSSDKVFAIVSKVGTQSFAIGWPVAVPEPSTWALMLAGFGGMGAMLRRQRKAAAVTA